ncbi:hypothetical protein GCM10009799_03520 [Nocardiopsis rhodophaea]|uniref:VanZ-like domain-containing protein n=1 Tax=Nocardiopsis rhodophaea TaxID=280238 RepID=A0ABN2S7C0_9ACTN
MACVGYLIILVPPIFGATGIGATEREVIWNPLNSFKEEDNTLEGSYIGQPGDESYIYYEAQELSEEEVEHAREEASPDDAAYYRYPVIGGGAVWFDSEGHDLDAEMRANLETSYPPEEYLMAGDDATEGLVAAEKILNALIFIPVGIVAFASFFSWWARLCIGPALSVLIEFGQWCMGAGRVSETADVIVNTAGHVLGVGIAAAATLLVGRRTAQARHRIRP